MRMPLSRSRSVVPVFDPFGTVIVTGSADGRHFDPRTQHRLLQGDGDLDMNIVVLAVKERMRLDMKLDIGIARRSTAEARHSLFF